MVRSEIASTTPLRSFPEMSAVREPGRVLPPTDAASLGCEMITVAGWTNSAIWTPDAVAIALSPRFSTITSACGNPPTTVFMSARSAVSLVG